MSNEPRIKVSKETALKIAEKQYENSEPIFPPKYPSSKWIENRANEMIRLGGPRPNELNLLNTKETSNA